MTVPHAAIEGFLVPVGDCLQENRDLASLLIIHPNVDTPGEVLARKRMFLTPLDPMMLRLLPILLLLSLATPALSGVHVYRFAKIIDGTGEVLDAHEIAVSDNKIVAVGDDLATQYDTESVKDLGGLVAVPGLIDVHVHITYALPHEPKGDAWAELSALKPSEILVASRRNAMLALEIGITTARDLYAAEGLGYHLRALIDAGVIPGPRLFLSGEGIHPSNLPEPADGEEQDLPVLFAKIANERADEGADCIKIFATTGSASDLTAEQTFYYPEIKAAVDAAHARGLKVAVHSYGPSAVADALRAGVDSIDHPVGLDDELWARWAATDVVYVPTVDHNRYYADHRAEYGYDEEIEANLRAFVRRNVESVRKAHEAGITIAMGSDALMTGFGQNTRELLWFIEAGMTPAEALKTATVNGAKLLGREDDLGRLQAGYLADIVAVSADPLKDIGYLVHGVRWVMKDGVVLVDKR